MVASDPEYGYNVPPRTRSASQRYCVTQVAETHHRRKQIEDGDYDEQANLDLVYGISLDACDLVLGKWAAILTYIDAWKLPPILVAGDFR